MKVPTTDYSPLMRANAERSQAKRTQFVAPNIDYQSKSLALKKRGLESDLSYLKSQETLGSLKFINSSLTGLIAGGLGAMEAKQAQEAQAMGHQQATDFQTFLAEGFANGDFYYEVQEVDGIDGGGQHLRLVGADKIQAFQNQQVEAMKAQGWMKGVQDQAISSMQNFYSGMQGKMAQDFWAKETADKFKLEQMNLNTAIEGDTADWLQTDYQRTDSFISGLQGYSPSAKAAMTASAHSQIDLGRAANQVRNTAASQGSAAGVAQANAISDQRNYTPDTRNRLIGYANQAAGQAKAAALAQGTQFMEQAIQGAEANGMTPDFAAIYDQARDNAKGMSDEAGKVYMDAVEKGHLTYCMNIYSNLTQDVDTMLPGEVEQALEDLLGIKAQFEGTPATKAVYGQIRNAFQNKADEYARLTAKADAEAQKAAHQDGKDLIAATLAVIEQTKNDFEGRGISGNAAMEQMQGVLLASKESLADKPITTLEYINFEKAADKLIKGVSDEQIENKVYKEEITGCMKDIDTFLNERFGNGNDKKVPLPPEQEVRILDAHNRAKGSLLDLAWDSKNLTSVEFAKRKNEIIAIFQMDNYDALTATPKSTNSKTQYEAAMEQTKRFEDNPQAVYYDERKGQFVWLDERLHSAYDNAARLEQEMLEKEYGIDIDYNKMPEYGKITGRRNEAGAELKELVPVFTSKDGDKYTVQGGKVYSYSEGAGVLVPKEILKQQNGKTKQKPEKKHNINNIMGGN